MNRRAIAIAGLKWTLGLVVLWQSLRLAFSTDPIHLLAKSGLPNWIRPLLAWSEIFAAALFLLPITSVIGGYALLAIFLFAAAIHMLHGEFDVGGLLVYGMGVIVIQAHRPGGGGEVTHDA